ncbi:MAG: thioredoxin family protein [Firmicutes bacterium]|nr:thioredoxin family protein [Bacillota bacterium]
MARVNPQYVVADMVDAMSFPALSDRFEVSSVPATIINGKTQQIGAVPESQLASAIREELHT